MTERLHFHFSLSCIGEGNGNPLQCSCLENPRDGGAWWAAVCGIAQSWTRLKRLSSSSSSSSSSKGSEMQARFLHITQRAEIIFADSDNLYLCPVVPRELMKVTKCYTQKHSKKPKMEF